MNRWMTCIATLVCTVICTGCWDSHEIDRLAIVTMSGTDLADDGKVLGSVQLARPSELGTSGGGAPSTSTGNTAAFILETSEAENNAAALEAIRRHLSRDLFMGHRRVVVVGEDFARQGVSPLMDEIVRNPRSRLRTYVVIAVHSQALSILQLPYALNRLPSDAIVDLEQNASTLGIDAKEFIQRLDSHGDPMTMGIEEISTLHGISNKSPQSFALEDIAIFQKDRLVGWLTGQTADGFRWLWGDTKGITTTVRVPGTKGTVSAELLRMKTRRSVRIVKGKVHGVVHVWAKYALNQNASSLNPRRPTSTGQIQRAIAMSITKDMQGAMHALQDQYQSDPLDFADDIYQKWPTVWKHVQPRWRSVYQSMPIDYEVNVRIANSGLTDNPVSVDSTLPAEEKSQ